jgi:chromosomal replication initiation ATPase DnaA
MRLEITNTRHDTVRSRTAAGRRTAGSLKQILEFAIAVAFGIETKDLRRRTRGRADAAFARQVAMYLGHVAYGLTYSDVGRVFERDRTTVAHACKIVEDRRDDAGIDRTLDLLEAVVAHLAHIAQRGGGIEHRLPDPSGA